MYFGGNFSSYKHSLDQHGMEVAKHFVIEENKAKQQQQGASHIHKFLCNNGKYKPFSYVCDGDNDCGDHSDEQLCGAIRSEFWDIMNPYFDDDDWDEDDW
jgi:hypothetical protein